MQASGFYRAEVAVEVHDQAPGVAGPFRPGPCLGHGRLAAGERVRAALHRRTAGGARLAGGRGGGGESVRPPRAETGRAAHAEARCCARPPRPRLASPGIATRAPAVRWQAELIARDLRPELLPAWPGRLSASARSEGALRDGRTVTRIEVERLHGELRGHPVEASLHGQVDGAQLTIEHLGLRSGRSQVEARGALGETLDLALSLDSPDLAELLPGAVGALRGSVQVAGSPRAPRVQGVFEGQRLGWQDWRIATLTLRAEAWTSPTARSTHPPCKRPLGRSRTSFARRGLSLTTCPRGGASSSTSCSPAASAAAK